MAEVETLHLLSDFVADHGILNRAEFESKLQILVDIARSGDGREKLAVANAVPTLLSLSPLIFPSSLETLHDSRTFILYVKLLRNLCAGNSVNQEALVSFDGLEAIAAVVQILAGGCSGFGGSFHEDGVAVVGESPAEAAVGNRAIEGLQMVLQLLGNVAGLGEFCLGRIWELFFPSVFEIVAKISSEKVQGPLGMIIYTCCRDNDSRCTELSESKGASIVALLLNRGSGSVSNSAPNEWLEFLITHLCFSKPSFRVLFNELGVTRGNIAETNGLSQMAADSDFLCCSTEHSFTKEQASLLDVLNASLSAQEEESHADDPSSNSHHFTSMFSASASFLVDIIRNSAICAASTGLSSLELPTQSLVADVLGLSLSMTRILCVLDENRSSMVPKFASSGLIPLMLDLLRALGPPTGAKASITSTELADWNNSSRELTHTSPAERSTDLGQPPADPTSTNRDTEDQAPVCKTLEGFPKRDVYSGYRRDVVAVIANASHRSLVVQEAVRENGGLLLVLQQCMPDTNNPFLREWGLWAIRNLLEGNSQNQSDLADLEIRSAVPDSRLRDAGMIVEINPETGRPRLVNVSPGAGNPAVDELI